MGKLNENATVAVLMLMTMWVGCCSGQAREEAPTTVSGRLSPSESAVTNPTSSAFEGFESETQAEAEAEAETDADAASSSSQSQTRNKPASFSTPALGDENVPTFPSNSSSPGHGHGGVTSPSTSNSTLTLAEKEEKKNGTSPSKSSSPCATITSVQTMAIFGSVLFVGAAIVA